MTFWQRRSRLTAPALARIAALLAVFLLATMLSGRASAQSLTPSGTVDDTMVLGLSSPTGFATFPHSSGDNVYTLPISATVTTTTPNVPVTLSVAGDGSGTPAQLGHLLTASGRALPLPLQVSGSTGTLMSLDQPIAPVLATWDDVVSSAPVTVELSQEIDGSKGVSAGPYGAEVLITLTSDAP